MNSDTMHLKTRWSMWRQIDKLITVRILVLSLLVAGFAESVVYPFIGPLKHDEFFMLYGLNFLTSVATFVTFPFKKKS